MTDGAGSTLPGTPYEMKFTDEFGNVGELSHLYAYMLYCYTKWVFSCVHTEIRNVDRPMMLSTFFRDSNCVDQHNHARQH